MDKGLAIVKVAAARNSRELAGGAKGQKWSPGNERGKATSSVCGPARWRATHVPVAQRLPATLPSYSRVRRCPRARRHEAQ